MNHIFFSIFCTIQYIFDRSSNTCDTYTGEFLLIVHHILSGYIFLGGFLFNPIYHLIFIIIILIHWITNNNRCALTVVTNEYCGYEETRNFNDFTEQLRLNEINENLDWYLLIGLITYDIIYLIKN